MGLYWVEYHNKDRDYHINKCTDATALLKMSAEIKSARAELDEMEQAIHARYNEIQRVIKYPQVEINREQNQYSRDKKVKINVRLMYSLMMDGKEIKKEYAYNTAKQFSYQEKKAAYTYADELSKSNNHCRIIDLLRR